LFNYKIHFLCWWYSMIIYFVYVFSYFLFVFTLFFVVYYYINQIKAKWKEEKKKYIIIIKFFHFISFYIETFYEIIFLTEKVSQKKIEKEMKRKLYYYQLYTQINFMTNTIGIFCLQFLFLLTWKVYYLLFWCYFILFYLYSCVTDKCVLKTSYIIIWIQFKFVLFTSSSLFYRFSILILLKIFIFCGISQKKISKKS